MKQFRILRKVATVPVVAGQFSTTDLPRGYDYESIFLRIYGGIQVTTNATSVRAEAPCQAVPRIEIISDGKNTLYSAPFYFACLGNTDRELLESGARATTPPSAATVATYQVEAIGVVDFMSSNGVRPKDTNFRSTGLSLFQARLTFGQALDSFVPGAGVAVFNNLNVDIFTQELVEGVDQNGNMTTPIALKKVSYQTITITASNTNQELRLPAGNMIKSVFVRTAGLVTAGEPSAGVINQAQLSAGTDVRLILAGNNIRAKNNADFGSITTGYYVLDLTHKGRALITLSDLWDVTNQAEPKLITDVVGGANVTMDAIVTEYIGAKSA